MLLCCMFTASVMVVPMLLLKNTVNGFLCTELQIKERFPRCSIHCTNVVHFPLLMIHLNKCVNNMWRNRKAFLKWYSEALLLACKDSVNICVSRTRVWRTLHEDGLYLYHPQQVQNQHPGDNAIHLQFCHWLHSNHQLLPLTLFTDEAIFVHNGINNTCNLR